MASGNTWVSRVPGFANEDNEIAETPESNASQSDAPSRRNVYGNTLRKGGYPKPQQDPGATGQQAWRQQLAAVRARAPGVRRERGRADRRR